MSTFLSLVLGSHCQRTQSHLDSAPSVSTSALLSNPRSRFLTFVYWDLDTVCPSETGRTVRRRDFRRTFDELIRYLQEGDLLPQSFGPPLFAARGQVGVADDFAPLLKQADPGRLAICLTVFFSSEGIADLGSSQFTALRSRLAEFKAKVVERTHASAELLADLAIEDRARLVDQRDRLRNLQCQVTQVLVIGEPLSQLLPSLHRLSCVPPAVRSVVLHRSGTDSTGTELALRYTCPNVASLSLDVFPGRPTLRNYFDLRSHLGTPVETLADSIFSQRPKVRFVRALPDGTGVLPIQPPRGFEMLFERRDDAALITSLAQFGADDLTGVGENEEAARLELLREESKEWTHCAQQQDRHVHLLLTNAVSHCKALRAHRKSIVSSSNYCSWGMEAWCWRLFGSDADIWVASPENARFNRTAEEEGERWGEVVSNVGAAFNGYWRQESVDSCRRIVTSHAKAVFPLSFHRLPTTHKLTKAAAYQREIRRMLQAILTALGSAGSGLRTIGLTETAFHNPMAHPGATSSRTLEHLDWESVRFVEATFRFAASGFPAAQWPTEFSSMLQWFAPETCICVLAVAEKFPVPRVERLLMWLVRNPLRWASEQDAKSDTVLQTLQHPFFNPRTILYHLSDSEDDDGEKEISNFSLVSVPFGNWLWAETYDTHERQPWKRKHGFVQWMLRSIRELLRNPCVYYPYVYFSDREAMLLGLRRSLDAAPDAETFAKALTQSLVAGWREEANATGAAEDRERSVKSLIQRVSTVVLFQPHELLDLTAPEDLVVPVYEKVFAFYPCSSPQTSGFVVKMLHRLFKVFVVESKLFVAFGRKSASLPRKANIAQADRILRVLENILAWVFWECGWVGFPAAATENLIPLGTHRNAPSPGYFTDRNLIKYRSIFLSAVLECSAWLGTFGTKTANRGACLCQLLLTRELTSKELNLNQTIVAKEVGAGAGAQKGPGDGTSALSVKKKTETPLLTSSITNSETTLFEFLRDALCLMGLTAEGDGIASVAASIAALYQYARTSNWKTTPSNSPSNSTPTNADRSEDRLPSAPAVRHFDPSRVLFVVHPKVRDTLCWMTNRTSSPEALTEVCRCISVLTSGSLEDETLSSRVQLFCTSRVRDVLCRMSTDVVRAEDGPETWAQAVVHIITAPEVRERQTGMDEREAADTLYCTSAAFRDALCQMASAVTVNDSVTLLVASLFTHVAAPDPLSLAIFASKPTHDALCKLAKSANSFASIEMVASALCNFISATEEVETLPPVSINTETTLSASETKTPLQKVFITHKMCDAIVSLFKKLVSLGEPVRATGGVQDKSLSKALGWGLACCYNFMRSPEGTVYLSSRNFLPLLHELGELVSSPKTSERWCSVVWKLTKKRKMHSGEQKSLLTSNSDRSATPPSSCTTPKSTHNRVEWASEVDVAVELLVDHLPTLDHVGQFLTTDDAVDSFARLVAAIASSTTTLPAVSQREQIYSLLILLTNLDRRVLKPAALSSINSTMTIVNDILRTSSPEELQAMLCTRSKRGWGKIQELFRWIESKADVSVKGALESPMRLVSNFVGNETAQTHSTDASVPLVGSPRSGLLLDEARLSIQRSLSTVTRASSSSIGYAQSATTSATSLPSKSGPLLPREGELSQLM
jgi:hypothetical protein